jgi:hypothetical protein
MIIKNRYAGKCTSCSKQLSADEGFAAKQGMKWIKVCNSSACFKRLGLPDPNAPQERKITEDGFIIMPYDPGSIILLKSLPGAKWIPETKQWSCSLKPGDLPRVVEIADQLSLDVPQSLRDKAKEGTVESKAAEIRANKTYNGKQLFPFQKVGVQFLALHDKALLGDDMGVGKQQAIDTLVLTPNGIVQIGTLSVGDYVIGSDGFPTIVTGVFPQGIKPSYALTFSDGLEVESGPEHLWAVDYYIGGRRLHRIVVTTNNIRTGDVIETKWPGRSIGKLNLSKTRLYLPILSGAVVFKPLDELIIPPYTMGALLGNGYLTDAGTTLTVNSLDKDEFIYFLEKENITIGAVHTYGGATRIVIKNAVGLIRQLGANVPSPVKSIPKRYFFGSPESRIALLQGLMDTDGSCSKTRNKVSFNSTSSNLAKDVCRLVCELGGLATICTYDRTKEGKPTEYHVRIKLPETILPFRIKRKSERYVPGNKSKPTRRIIGIRYVRDVESVCISVAASDHLYACENGILTHNTVQALVALPENERVLVICPATLKYNWRDEIAMWRPSYRVTICNGKEETVTKALAEGKKTKAIPFKIPEPGEIVICNYDILPNYLTPAKDSGKVSQKGKSILVANLTIEQETALREANFIGDEFHLCKNYKAARTQKVSQLTRLCNRVWALSGTPLMNRPQDLFGVLSAGNINVFGSWENFLQLFNGYKNQWGGYEFGMPSPEAPERMRRVMLRRLKSEVLKDLPPKIYQDIEVDCDGSLTKKIDALLSKTTGKKNINYEELDLEELPSFSEFSLIRAMLAESRIPAMLEIVESYEESETPLVIFSAHKAPIEALKDRIGWKIITGDTEAEERRNTVRDFQEGKLKGIALTIKVGGMGVTLTRSTNMLFVDLEWVPSLNIQAEDRLVRIGAVGKHVLIMRMSSSHALDRHIQNLLAHKIELAYRALEVSIKLNPPPPRLEVTIMEETNEEMMARINSAGDEVEREIALEKLQGVLVRESEKAKKVPEPKLTAQKKEILRSALEYMVSVCDGAETRDGIGFNKADAFIARWIGFCLRDEDEVSYRVLERVLVRYRKQLGERFSSIWEI